MSNYGFGKDNQPSAASGLKLPPQAPRAAPPATVPIEQLMQVGAEHGFVSREPVASSATSRKPGRRRTEPQDKISVTGPKRIIDRLKAYCDKMGEPSYCTAIERLLDMAEKNGN